MIPGLVVLLLSLWKLGRLKEMHHGYLGGLLCLTSLAPIGLVLLYDDAVQHAVQVFRPSFLSPLHWLYGVTLWRLPWVRRLNAWLDGG